MSFDFSGYMGQYYMGGLYRQNIYPYYMGNIYSQNTAVNSAVNSALNNALNNALNDVAEKAGYPSFQSALAASLKEQGFEDEKFVGGQTDATKVTYEKPVIENKRKHHLD